MQRYIVVALDERNSVEFPDVLEFHFNSTEDCINSWVWEDAATCVKAHGLTAEAIEYVAVDPNDNDW